MRIEGIITEFTVESVYYDAVIKRLAEKGIEIESKDKAIDVYEKISRFRIKDHNIKQIIEHTLAGIEVVMPNDSTVGTPVGERKVLKEGFDRPDDTNSHFTTS